MPVIPKITDAYVSIDVQHPQPVVGLKNPAIFVKGDAEAFKQYTYLDQVEADFSADTSTYRQAETIFNQEPAPDAIAVITFTGDSAAPVSAPTTKDVSTTPTNDGANVSGDGVVNKGTSDVPTSGIAKAAFDYFYLNWEFALLADYNKDDALALADIIDNGGYDAKGFHILFLQFDADNKADKPAFDKFQRTFTFYHTDSDEYYVAALAAKGAQGTIGSVSWKFVGDLNGITPESMSASDIIALQNQGFILYVTKGNASNQTDDKNVFGYYIDFVHGLDDVKSSLENDLQATLNGDGTGTKIPYNAQGLAMVNDCMTGTLSIKYGQGIIGYDDVAGKPAFNVNIPGIADIKTVDIAQRILKNVKFSYTPGSAINKIYVNGTANALI